MLYRDQFAVIEAEGICSEKIDLKRGVKHGCPLSPLLFALMIEPFAIAVRNNKDIQGFYLGKAEAKLALYAADVVCTVC